MGGVPWPRVLSVERRSTARMWKRARSSSALTAVSSWRSPRRRPWRLPWRPRKRKTGASNSCFPCIPWYDAGHGGTQGRKAMAQNGQPVDNLVARIQRVLREDVASLLAGAADPRALATQIRARLAGLLDEAEAALHTLRAEAERWRAARS